jgi:cytochrome c-type biogenesis protein CcmH/NrfG
MAKANRLYESEKFLETAARLQALADAGVRDGRLYYNLGAAYFKIGDVGRAVLNFRRAQVLLPRDDDVAASLRLARTMTLDHIEVGGRETLASVARRIVERTTLNEAAYFALLL